MHSAESPSLNEAYNESDIAPHDGERIRIAPEDPRYDDRLRWTRSEAQRGAYVDSNRWARKKPSLVRRMMYAATRFVVAVLIGVAATLAWQAYGHEARARLATMDPSLAWLIPPPAAQPSPAAAALSSADLAQQLKPMAAEIAAIRQDVAQLAGKQEQSATNEGRIFQSLAAIHALEQDIGLKVSSLAQPKPKPAHVQPHPPAPAPRSLRPPDEPDGR